MIQTAVIIAEPHDENGPMASRLPTYLHPVAGRPVLWHMIMGLIGEGSDGIPIQVWGPEELEAIFQDGVPATVTFVGPDQRPDVATADDDDGVLIVMANGHLTQKAIFRLKRSGVGWVGSGSDDVVARVVPAPRAPDVLGAAMQAGSGIAPGGEMLEDGSFCIRNRRDLARAHEEVRARLVHGLMENGVTFILPSSVVVDVDVRIGRDTIIYPGVVIEGNTTIGEETVIGPGCRIIESWIGSGVELKGWNYISNTSVRNRAILEPYVRRGFDQ